MVNLLSLEEKEGPDPLKSQRLFEKMHSSSKESWVAIDKMAMGAVAGGIGYLSKSTFLFSCYLNPIMFRYLLFSMWLFRSGVEIRVARHRISV